MVCGKNHKTIDVRKEDLEFMEGIRKTPFGTLSYAEVFHSIVMFWKENH